MSVAMKCDICGKYYESYNIANTVLGAKTIHNGFVFVSVDNKREYFQGNIMDCCPNCLENIKKHIESLKNNLTEL